jgi:hypothetical protein
MQFNTFGQFYQKLLKKALLRVNRFFNMDSAYFYEQLAGKLDSKNIELILSELSSKHILNPLMETSTTNSLKLERDYLRLIKIMYLV